MFDTVKLIKEIELRDQLWNVDSVSYMDKTARKRAWEEIGTVLYRDWNTFSSKHKEQEVNFLIKKWTNIRDYYMREKKRLQSSTTTGPGKKKKQYYYYDSLRFLDAVKPRKRRRFSDGQETENYAVEYSEDTSNDMIVYEQYVENGDSISESSPAIKQEDEASSPKPMPLFETHVLPSTDKSHDMNVTAHKNFLLSLIPDVTSLNERQNMKFRLGVLNLLNDIKFGQE